MGKSILVLNDTPKTCIECPCHFAEDTGRVWCGKEKKELLTDDIETFKPEWCPIRKMPDKRDLKDIEEYSGLGMDYVWGEGYNACIDKILKGEKI